MLDMCTMHMKIFKMSIQPSKTRDQKLLEQLIEEMKKNNAVSRSQAQRLRKELDLGSLCLKCGE